MTPSRKQRTGEPAVPDRHRRPLLAVIAVSVVLRLAAAFYLGNSVAPLPGIFDQVSYHTLAGRVLEGHGFTFGTGWWPATAANEPTAHWSFVYVLWLAGIYGVGGTYPLVARLLQAAAVGVLQPLLTYRVAARVFGARVGLVSASVVAVLRLFRLLRCRAPHRVVLHRRHPLEPRPGHGAGGRRGEDPDGSARASGCSWASRLPPPCCCGRSCSPSCPSSSCGPGGTRPLRAGATRPQALLRPP